jgi:hypothetical protein
MDRSGHRRRIEWGHIALITIIAGSALAYLFDARATSTAANNIALVQPAAIFVLILAAIVLSQTLRKAPDAAEADGADKKSPAEIRTELARVGLLAAAFGAFALSLETLGFDLATLLFVAMGLYLCGERRFWVIAVYSILFTLIVVTGYQFLVPFPFPMMVL